jgi:hypothetical protein
LLREIVMQLLNCSKFEAHAKMAHRRAPYDNIWLLDEDGNPTKTLKGLAPGEVSEGSAGRLCSKGGGGDSVTGGMSWPRRAVAPTLRCRIAASDDATLVEPELPELPQSDDETPEGAWSHFQTSDRSRFESSFHVSVSQK